MEVGFDRVSVFSRAGFEAVFLILIIVYPNRKKLEGLSLITILTGLFLLSIVLYSVFISSALNIAEHLVVYNKYIFVFVVFYALYELKFHDMALKHVAKVLEFIFILNAMLALSGLIFDLPVFGTYLSRWERFGYDGFIVAQNEATFFCFLSLSYFYQSWQFRNEKGWKFIVVLASCLIIGTKGYYIFLVFLALYHMYAHPNKIRNWTIIGGGLIATFSYVIFNFDQFEFYAHHLKKYGLLTMALSGRDELLIEHFTAEIYSWSPIQYFIGGHDLIIHLIEMDFFDLVLSFGLIGTILYLFVQFRTIFNFPFKFHFPIFFVCCYYFLAGLGGHFFGSAVNSLYVVLVCLILQKYYETLASGKAEK